MRSMPDPMGDKTERDPPVAVAAAAARGGARPGSEAIDLILRQSSGKEGRRHVWIGKSRSGKSRANRALVEALPDPVILIHDRKGIDPEYAGRIFLTAQGLRDEVAAGKPIARVSVFREDSTEHVAALGRDLARLAGLRVAVVFDELARAASPAGVEWLSSEPDASGEKVSHARYCFTEGGGIGLSVVGLAQSVQRTPVEALSEARTIGVFRLRARAASLMARTLDLDPEVEEAARGLGEFEFLILDDGEWNRRVYRF